MVLDAAPRGHLDQLGQSRQRLGAELARLALQRMRRNDQRGRVAGAHRLLDRGDRLDAVLAEIAENPDEIAAELATRPLESGPSTISPDSSVTALKLPQCWIEAPPQLHRTGKHSVSIVSP